VGHAGAERTSSLDDVFVIRPGFGRRRRNRRGTWVADATEMHRMGPAAAAALTALAATGCTRGATSPTISRAGGVAEMQAGASFHTSLRQAADLNDAFRRVLFTGGRSQVSLMTIPPRTDVGIETYSHVEQVVFVASGEGKAIVGRTEWPLAEGDVVVIPAGTPHAVLNTSIQPLRIVIVETPPRHMDGVVHPTRDAEDADLADRAFGAAAR
jgi:mannose-6-phosphate isomerase-like protein (cupin superfamily)